MRHALYTIGAFLVFVVVSSASAAQQSKITASQWQKLYDLTRSKPGQHLVSRPDLPSVVAIEVPSDRKIFYFATSGPAYPAVLIAELIQQDSHIYLEKRGYFAGFESDFAQWFETLNVRVEDFRDIIPTLASH